MLRDTLSKKKSMFISPRDDVPKTVLIPSFKAAKNVDIMMGYFSSSSFIEIADGLATFLNETDGKIRLIISPVLTSQDTSISEMTKDELAAYVEQTIFDIKEGEEHIVNYCLACFGWMLLEQRIEIKIATVDDGIFHSKVWLFHDDEEICALHGSMNQTHRGIKNNVENLTLSRPWISEERQREVFDLVSFFNEVYDNNAKQINTYNLSTAIEKKLIQKYASEHKSKPLSELSSNQNQPIAQPEAAIEEIRIPEHLVYEKGDFKHQGEALSAWKNSAMSGILHMATGAGKTITSLLCAHAFQERYGEVMVFITAPQSPLLLQWVEEVQDFSIAATNLSNLSNWDERQKAIANAGRKLKFKVSRAEVFVISNALLKKNEFKEILSQITVDVMLIADECHNFGKDFLDLEVGAKFEAKLGLSATPKRQYDAEGTEYLESFFGPTCFSFTLEDAIGKCLTPYDYYIHPVYLDSIEMDEFVDLTQKISALSWQNDSEDSSQLDHLRRQRRKLIETAETKISVLRSVLNRHPSNLKHALIYCTDKDPLQLQEVNKLLSNGDYLFRQITDVETSSKHETQKILQSFREGQTRILTAKRVLDEGVNIPETQTAFILASNTIERQWTQRRGRILRKCSALAKTHATIHDFVVLPPSLQADDPSIDDYDKKLISLELTRLHEFARLARNRLETDGAFKMITKLNKLLGDEIAS